MSRIRKIQLVSVCAVFLAGSVFPAEMPLPSWSDTGPRRTILAFVSRVTNPASPDFVPVPERIAVFDNDGTLWCEQPMYAEVAFTLDRVKALAPQHPEWKVEEPFATVLKGDVQAALASERRAAILAATHAGMTTDDFARIVSDWIAKARHPRFGRVYTELTYQPMLELLSYLRANGFKTFIVSGGGQAFLRPWTERAYGIPPEQVVGSVGQTKYEFRNGVPVLFKLPEVELVDDGEGKPVGIDRFIGRQPILAFGNSDGDQQMLEWTARGRGPRLMALVHHTDAIREYAYDRNSPVGRLDKAWDEAVARGWTVVDMKADWKTIFPQAAAAGKGTSAGVP